VCCGGASGSFIPLHFGYKILMMPLFSPLLLFSNPLLLPLSPLFPSLFPFSCSRFSLSLSLGLQHITTSQHITTHTSQHTHHNTHITTHHYNANTPHTTELNHIQHTKHEAFLFSCSFFFIFVKLLFSYLFLFFTKREENW
jgi:hypothetical protein